MNSGRARWIFTGLGGLGIRFDTINGEGFEFALVFLKISVAEISDGIGAAFDALDEDIVIFRELGVGSVENGFFAFGEIRLAIGIEVGRTHDGFDEVVEGTRVGAGAEAQDRLSGPLRADIGPVGSGREDRGQFFLGHIGDEVIFAADNDCQCVNTDLELDRRASRCQCATALDLAVLDGAGGVGDVGLAGLCRSVPDLRRNRWSQL